MNEETNIENGVRCAEPVKPVILLDLNYTLVANSREKKRDFMEQIQGEQYRLWLVKLIVDHVVVLITARPAKYEMPTMRSILSKTKWLPQASYFNTHNERPPEAKRRVLETFVFKRFGVRERYLAIESNPATRAMYESYGIPSIWVDHHAEPWTKLPNPYEPYER